MTPPLIRICNGRTEYWCSTTKQYYIPKKTVQDPDGVTWCFCELCDTEGRAWLPGRDAQPHCYPKEATDAPNR